MDNTNDDERPGNTENDGGCPVGVPAQTSLAVGDYVEWHPARWSGEMSRKKFTPGQDVEVRGVGHLGWRPAVYVGIYVGTNAAHRGRHVVETVTTGRRVVPDGRIRPLAVLKPGDRREVSNR